MLTLTLERTKSNCILQLWSKIVRPSQIRPLDSSFVLCIDNALCLKNHWRPILHTLNIIGSNVQLVFLYFWLLIIIHGKESPCKTHIAIYGIELIFSCQDMRRQPSLGQLCHSGGFMQTQGHTGTNQTAERKQSTPWGNSSLLPKSTQAPISHPLKTEMANAG